MPGKIQKRKCDKQNDAAIKSPALVALRFLLVVNGNRFAKKIIRQNLGREHSDIDSVGVDCSLFLPANIAGNA